MVASWNRYIPFTSSTAMNISWSAVDKSSLVFSVLVLLVKFPKKSVYVKVFA